MDTKVTSSVVTATRIAAGGDRTHYDNIAITLHWLTVVLVLALFGLAETWSYAARPTRHFMIVAHMTLGILLAAVLILRVAWRLIPGHRAAAAVSGRVEIASKAMHYLLYLLLAAQAVLGFVLRWSGNEAMSFFGLLLPPPFEPFSKPAHQLVGEAHEWVGWTIIILAGCHALAALFHHFVLRDDVLWRMLPGGHVQARGDSGASPEQAARGRSTTLRPVDRT